MLEVKTDGVLSCGFHLSYPPVEAGLLRLLQVALHFFQDQTVNSIVKRQDSTLESPEFIQRLKQQEQAGFRTLVKHFHKRLLGFAASITGETFA